jgi:Ca2+-binding RTX toxin-like protein
MAVLFGTNGNDVLTGTGANDFIDGEGGNDTLNGGNGSDFLNGEDGNDFHDGGNGDDIIDGDAGNDTLLGSAGNDFLDGEDGNDILNGGNGSDTLIGEDGNDNITGGSGGDRFLFVSEDAFKKSTLGVDTITDFGTGADRIVLYQSTFTALTPQNGGAIASAEFAVVANDADADNSTAFITYSTGSGQLFYNTDGATEGFGNGGDFAVLQGTPTLTASDILVA